MMTLNAVRALGAACLLCAMTAGYSQPVSPPKATPGGVLPAAQIGQAAPPQCDSNCVRANAGKASEACARRIEAQAPSDFDWISRPNPGIFQQADPSSPTDSVVRFRGDSIRFMTAEKSWMRISYECGYDVRAQAVTFVNVRAGRLDQPLSQVKAPATNVQPAGPALVAAPVQSQTSPQARPPRPHVGEPSPIEIEQQAANPKHR
jgi:hypothetical protein